MSILFNFLNTVIDITHHIPAGRANYAVCVVNLLLKFSLWLIISQNIVVKTLIHILSLSKADKAH